METITIDEARTAYSTATHAISFIPKTDNVKYFIYYDKGYLYHQYNGVARKQKLHFDEFAFATQRNCNRQGYTYLKGDA